MNNTDEYWSIRTPSGEDISLHQYGWSVTTVGGSRYDLPPRRGSDLTVAYRPGQLHRQKLPDARQITLVMFMVGWDPATGNAPADGDQRLQWNNNWDTLRRAVYRHSGLIDQRFTLYRRWWLSPQATFKTAREPTDPDSLIIAGEPGVPPATPRLVTAFAQAEMTGTMAPSMTGRFRSDFQLDFTLADPFFYGDLVTADMNFGEAVNMWNDGHDLAGPGSCEVHFVGPLDRPKLFNLSTDPQCWVSYDGYIPVGKRIRLVVNKFVCQISNVDGSDNHNAIGKLQNYGSRWWMPVLPGANRFAFTGGAGGAGHCTVLFRPPYV